MPFFSESNFAAAAIPLAWGLTMIPHTVKFLTLMSQQGPQLYDNTQPRTVSLDAIFPRPADAPLKELCQRCQAAHNNGWENLPFFSSAVLMAKACGVAALQLNPLVETYLYSRLVYNVIYMLNVNAPLAALRSVVYFAGVGVVFQIFNLAITASDSPRVIVMGKAL